MSPEPEPAAAAVLPRGLPVGKAEDDGVAALDQLAGQDQLGSVLLDLGPLDLDGLVRFEGDPHLVEEALGTNKDVDSVFFFVGTRLRFEIGEGLASLAGAAWGCWVGNRGKAGKG